jgi:hypothetical protein
VQPLRAVRVALRSGPQPAPNAATGALRGQIKPSELQAERLQSDFLAAWLQHKAGDLGTVTNQERRAALAHIVALACNDRPAGDIDQASEAITEAAQRVAASDPSGPRFN